jgi:hypothetical protein
MFLSPRTPSAPETFERFLGGLGVLGENNRFI